MQFTHEHILFFIKYLNRNGVATPAEIINAVQEGTWVIAQGSSLRF